MGPLKKYVTCIMAFFIPFNFVTLSYFYSVTSPVKLQNERNEDFFAYMTASSYQFISKEVENQSFRHKWIFNTDVCISNSHWQSSEIVTFLCKYYIVISDTLVGSFCALFIILSGLYEKPRTNKDWVTEN